eukprot:11898463-Ditylum_brightwellii.AAC.1
MMTTLLDIDDNKDNKKDRVMIAEATDDDWIWGTGLSENTADTTYPNKWKGYNILGWALMQATNFVLGVNDGCGSGKDTGCIAMLTESKSKKYDSDEKEEDIQIDTRTKSDTIKYR